MEQIELNGYELYDILVHIKGLKTQDNVQFLGFVNEKELTEGTKRMAARVGKVIENELATLNNQRMELQSKDSRNKAEKDVELMNEKIKITIEKLDFSKIENLKLSENYQMLYDKIFK